MKHPLLRQLRPSQAQKFWTELVSRHVSLMLQEGLDPGVISPESIPYWRTRAEQSQSAHAFHAWSQLVAFFKKCEGWSPSGHRLPSPSDLEHSALGKWEESEQRCHLFNAFMENCPRNRLPSVMWSIRHQIWSLLGDSPPSDWYDDCYVSPGAAIGVRSDRTSIPRRFSQWESRTVTAGAALHALHALRRTRFVSNQSSISELGLDRFDPLKACIVRGNKVSFVPKTIDSFRVIAVEPLLNGFLQSGIDTILRRKLLRWGVDLRDQRKNQELSRQGSIDGSYATIDLSSASDNISRELVRFLLPPDWYFLLNDIRSKVSTVKGEDRVLQKFVSMGNNFCFPLQSMIFAAVCRVFTTRYSVYGDDIIVSGDASSAVVDTLHQLGFVVNTDKTFCEGPFRESCGADWWSGAPVRPAYVRRSFEYIENLHSFLNSLREKGPYGPSFVDEFVMDHPQLSLLRPIEYLHDASGGGAISVPLAVAVRSRYVRFDRSLFTFKWREIGSRPKHDDVRGIDPSGHYTSLAFLQRIGTDSRGDSATPTRFSARRVVSTRV